MIALQPNSPRLTHKNHHAERTLASVAADLIFFQSAGRFLPFCGIER
jgi:hypothetical protein